MAIPGGSSEGWPRAVVAAPVPAVMHTLARRADAMGNAEQSAPASEAATQYILLLEACRAVLDAAPHTPKECATPQIEQRLIDALVTLATTLAVVLPGGPREMFYYLSEEQQQAAWGSNGTVSM